LISGVALTAESNNKRMPVGSIKLDFAGELVVVRCPDRKLAGLFRRYEALFEVFANMPREERLINYKFINGLMLTSYAKKAAEKVEKKKLFDYKNEVFLSIANNRESRRKVAFKYLVSKNFRVLKFCDSCIRKNTEANADKHAWKYCNTCEVDHNFYNVLSMHHKFDAGSSTLFLSNDLVAQVKNINLAHRGKLADFTEEAQFQKYHYNVRNLDAFDLNSVLEMHRRIGKF